uniref:Uncharacterized protein n=1 Tax=Myoviridae sp. ctjhW4 TaxID=2825162 RepID=A0A8S5PS36_9CAUD|nr:MAG TPA: hypothetical protein [Myoviridae sp. ctjhW4]
MASLTVPYNFIQPFSESLLHEIMNLEISGMV